MQEYCIQNFKETHVFRYLLELPQWGNSNKYPKHVLWGNKSRTRPFLHINQLIKYSVQHQIHFNGNFFGNKWCHCNEGSLYFEITHVSALQPVWLKHWGRNKVDSQIDFSDWLQETELSELENFWHKRDMNQMNWEDASVKSILHDVSCHWWTDKMFLLNSVDNFEEVLQTAILMLSMPGKHLSRQHFKILVLFFQENSLWHFMQIVSSRDNLHEISEPVFMEK